MSVRNRIDKFEALSQRGNSDRQLAKDDKSKDRNNEAVTRGKRFHFPGNGGTMNSDTDSQTIESNFTSTTRPQKNVGLQDFEADLQEVWSVKKNIHHNGGSNHIPKSSSSTTINTIQLKPALYSRHGAIPAQQTRGPQIQSIAKDSFNRGNHHSSRREDSFEPTRNSLQDKQPSLKASPWNVKKSGYSYNSQAPVDSVAKRPIASPHATEASFMPAAKRRTNMGGMGAVRPTNEIIKGTSFSLQGSTDFQDEKVSYAKKMAQGYLKSVGIGEFTPKTDMYTKEKSTPISNSSNSISTTSKWKKSEDDQEFEFEF